jgi:iron complex outermembrane recepter protein
MKSWMCTILVFLTALKPIFAQTGVLKGFVNNNEGKPAPFVTVQLKELQRGTNSNERGEFVISNIKSGSYTLVASFVGYKTLEQNVKIEEGKTLNLALELFENTETLKEIVVKGYLSQNERISSIGKLAAKAMDLPLSMQTIDRSVLENQQVLTLQDVLMNTNGVYVMGTTGGYQEEIAARGFSMGSSNTFKNGTRFVNSMSPELSGLERVEVLKGSAAFLFGNVAAGGILNLVTKKPKFGFGGEMSFRTGSFGLLKPSFDVYGSIGKGEVAAFRINGSLQKANSFRQYVTSERVYLNPSLLFKLGKKTDFLVEVDYLEDNRTADFGAGMINYSIIPDYPLERFVGVKWGYVKSQQLASIGTLTHRFNSNWKLNLSSTYRQYEQEIFANTRPNAGTLIKPDGLWTRSITKSENFDDYYIVQADLNGNFKTCNINHETLIGFDTDNFVQKTQAYANFANYDKINILQNLPENVRNDVPTMTKTNFTDAPTKRYGLYAQDLVSANEKLKLLLGLRYTNQTSESKITTADGVTTTTTNTDGVYSPRLGLVYQPSKNHSAFASYSNSFVLNTGVNVEGGILPPSIVHECEVGLKNELLKNKLSANVAFYRINNENMAQMSLANGNTYAYIKELVGYVRSRGAEIDFTARPTPSLSLMAGYSFNETKYIQSNTFVEGSLLRYNPNHTANASVQYQSLSGSVKGLRLGFTSAYIGTRYAGRSTRVQVANDAYRLIELPDYFQFDATAGYTLKKILFRVKVGNVFDVISYNVHDDNSMNPISPRNYSFSLIFHF